MAENEERDEQATKVEFSEAQQKKLNAIIDKRFGELKQENEELKATVDAMEASKAKQEQGTSDLDGQMQAVAVERKRLQILTALASHPVVDVDAACALLDGQTIFDDGTVVGLGTDGEPRLDKAGGRMSIKDYVADFLQERPYLLKARPSSGAGSFSSIGDQGNQGGASLNRREFDTMTPGDKGRFIRSGGKLTD